MGQQEIHCNPSFAASKRAEERVEEEQEEGDDNDDDGDGPTLWHLVDSFVSFTWLVFNHAISIDPISQKKLSIKIRPSEIQL